MKITFLLLILTAVLSASAADRTPPTKPTNFRVLSKTAYAVTLGWNSSSDNSGSFSYIISSSAHSSEQYLLSKTTRSFTFTRFLAPLGTYTFSIKAKDAAGNTSGTASLTTQLPTDPNAIPAAPLLSATEVAPAAVTLVWVPGEGDGQGLQYDFFINGSLFWNMGTSRGVTVNQLFPNTTYTFNVRARNTANRVSLLSNPVTVTTPPVSTDEEPPSAPSNLVITANQSDCEEVILTWTQSTDNESEPSELRYDVFVNGDYFESQFGTGGPAIVYGVGGFSNAFEVIAVDANGNESAPGRLEALLCP